MRTLTSFVFGILFLLSSTVPAHAMEASASKWPEWIDPPSWMDVAFADHVSPAVPELSMDESDYLFFGHSTRRLGTPMDAWMMLSRAKKTTVASGAMEAIESPAETQPESTLVSPASFGGAPSSDLSSEWPEWIGVPDWM